MEIRPVRDDDHERWFEMRVALFPGFDPDLLRTEMGEILSRSPREICLVAEDDGGRLVGFAEGNVREAVDGCDTRDVGYLEGWFVEPDFRRRGVGRALVDACLEWARGKGCAEFASDCDLENELSLKAHLAIGFEETNRVIQFRRRL